MRNRDPKRGIIRATVSTAVLTLCPAALLVAQGASSAQVQQVPAPIERRAPAMPPRSSSSGVAGQGNAAQRRGAQGEHLAEWMSQHSTLSPEQQQQALEREPGFQDLPHNTQQRMLNRLAQLDSMNPERRQRVLARTEALEHLNPDQRSQVRGAMAQLGGLPVEDRRVVARTFRELRELPQDQRVAALDSGRYGPPLNGQQRAVLFNLLRVEPLMGSMLVLQAPRSPADQVPAMGLR